MKNITIIISLLITSFALSQDPWINEVHYDNTGADTLEGVEVAVYAGVDLSCYDIVLYNGASTIMYDSMELAGMVMGNCFGTFWFGVDPTGSIQNGSPDGIALVFDPTNSSCSVGGVETVIQFLSYEGAFTATDGPASGMNSTDIGVAESGTTPIGSSLQLTGTGTQYSDFTWSGLAVNPSTYTLLNNQQVILDTTGAIEYATECFVYNWPANGQNYTSTGVFTTIVSNVVTGCDSLATLDLIIETVDINVTQVGTQLLSNQSGGTYQWLDCDNNYAVIGGETNQAYSPAITGNYAVEVTLGSCTDTSVCYLVDYTGIQELYFGQKELVKIVDFMGRETEFKPNTPLIYIYSDGTREKSMEIIN